MCENVRKNEDGNSRSEGKAEYNDCFVNGKPYVHSNTVQKSLEYLFYHSLFSFNINNSTIRLSELQFRTNDGIITR